MKLLALLDEEFKPLGLEIKVWISKLNFNNFWVKVKQASEMRGLPLAAINLDDLFDILIKWQDRNLVPKGVRIKIGFLH
jgi:hypothetical protein